MEIKTVIYKQGYAELFDEEVNALLSSGWSLDKRYTTTGGKMIAELYRDPVKELEIDVKYFNPNLPALSKNPKGDWIDLRSAESFSLKAGESKIVKLGIGMILPPGYEAIVAPRSSTFNNYGLIVTNSIGIIDNSYSGDGDEWGLLVYALRDSDVDEGDRIAQFRIIESMDPLKISTVDHLRDVSRGGFGSTGTR